MRDKSENERLQLTQKLINLDYLEDDFNSMNRRHQDKVLETANHFQYLNHQIIDLLSESQMTLSYIEQELMTADELNRQMVAYLDLHLENLETIKHHFYNQLEEKREALIKERSNLPWE